ncbi:hypothetical protein [Labrys monachus]|uniref:hypothetical protein n=1 Tax=Labrys monachus TaxID=217067 RepID=UPI0027D8D3FF|nr:hypothetical protein [Labrys monachus]
MTVSAPATCLAITFSPGSSRKPERGSRQAGAPDGRAPRKRSRREPGFRFPRKSQGAEKWRAAARRPADPDTATGDARSAAAGKPTVHSSSIGIMIESFGIITASDLRLSFRDEISGFGPISRERYPRHERRRHHRRAAET